MKNAEKFVHPTRFTGNWPNWNGYTWLDWSPEAKSRHPGDDYNFGNGADDLGQDVSSIANGVVYHTSKSDRGYGHMVIIKHTIGYNLKRFIKETYGVETDTLYSLYAHLQKIIVATGNEVEAGAKIAEVGKTGTNSPHLHAEIYHLERDLIHTNYRFYPVGWTSEKIKENWLPIYNFIESTKNIESYEQFLGKSKEYWLTVEKDRESLLKQLGQKEQEFLKILAPIQKQLEDSQKEVKRLDDLNASFDTKLKSIEESYQIGETEFKRQLIVKDDIIKEQKIRITEILSEQSEKLKIGEATILLVETLKNYYKNYFQKKE